MMKHSHLRDKRGLTLTEIAVVFMIIGVVLTALWISVQAVYTNMRIGRTAKNISGMVHDIRSIYGLSQNFMMEMTIAGEEGAVSLARAGAVPRDFWNDPENPTRIIHPWGNSVLVDSLRTQVNGDSFRISLVALPQSICAEILLRMAGERRDGMMLSAGTNTAVQTANQLPITIATAAADCPNALNDVYLTFMLKSGVR